MTFLSGGGVSSSGSDSAEALLAWQREQQAQQELSKKREAERSDTTAQYRRNDLADRSGYSGTVMVGDAVKETDATLQARMDQLDPADPQRVAYEQALTAQDQQQAEARRVITGEQYKAEDAFTAAAKVDDNASSADIQAAIDKIGKLTDTYNFYDPAALLDDLNKKLADAKKREATPPPGPTPDTGA